jgi:hypothetical protein
MSRWLQTGFFYPEDGGDKFLRNDSSRKIYTAHIPEDGILRSHRRENLKSYNTVTAGNGASYSVHAKGLQLL